MRASGGARRLDFVVIGASKSGTTSLFHYLREHPRLWLPAGKDAPFFSADSWYERGWDWAARESFHGAPPDRLWGTVTPRYMEDPRVPRRMAGLMPHLRLVALLRNPIDRAFSQYRQQARRGKETRPFEEAVATQLAAQESHEPNPFAGDVLADRHLAPGLYGSILEGFLAFFPPAQLHVAFAEELGGQPGETLDGLFVFLGLAPGFRPSNLGRRYHTGGSRERFPWLIPVARRVAPLKLLWKTLPRARRRAIWMRFFTEINVVPDQAGPSPALRRDLADFFGSDVRRLERIIGRPAPWADFATRSPRVRRGGARSVVRPLVSVVVPTFNRFQLLTRALDSVLRQGLTDLELIVVDDGSSDESAALVASLADPRLRYERQRHAGRSAARNRGAALARGEILTFLDSDDEALAGWLEAFVQALADPRVGVACCGARVLVSRPDRGGITSLVELPRDLGPLYHHRRGLFLAGTFAVRTELFRRLDGFDETLAFAENTDLKLRLVQLCVDAGWRIACIDRPLMVFHQRRPALDRHTLRERLAAAERILERHGRRYRELAPGAYANYHAIAAVQASRLGAHARSRRHLRAAIGAAPWNWAHYGRLVVACFPPLARQVWRRNLGQDH